MRNYLNLFFCFLCLSVATAQEEEDDAILDSLIDDFLKTENNELDDFLYSLTNFNFIYTSTTYNSNTYFAGREIGFSQYNISPQITYANSNGFYAGITGTFFSEFYPKWDVTITYLGFGKSIGEKEILNYNIGYSRYFYAHNEDNIFANTLDIGVGVRTKNKKLNSLLTGTYLFGKENSFQLFSKSYLKIAILDTRKVSLKFKPQLNIIAGIQTIELSRITTINNVQTVNNSKNDVFDLINTQIQLPLEMTFHSFDLDFGYTYNFPNSIGNEKNLNSTGFFHCSLGYLIEL